MTTITAKELRNHLDEIVTRVRRGETIRVTYRSRAAFRLEPDTATLSGPKPGSPEAMKRFIQMVEAMNQNRAPVLDPHKSIKQLEHELLDADPKYQARK